MAIQDEKALTSAKDVKELVSTKQDKLPDYSADKYLHVNIDGKTLEWAEVRQGGTSFEQITGQPEDNTNLKRALDEKTEKKVGNSHFSNEDTGGHIYYETEDIVTSTGVHDGSGEGYYVSSYAYDKKNDVYSAFKLKLDGLYYINGPYAAKETSKVTTIKDLETKQDKLPKVVKDKYLHTNSETGVLEWSAVAQGSSAFKDLSGQPEDNVNLKRALDEKQVVLIDSGEEQNLKTINGQSLLGKGDIPISGGEPDKYIKDAKVENEKLILTKKDDTTIVELDISGKQNKLGVNKPDTTGTLTALEIDGINYTISGGSGSGVQNVLVDGKSVVKDGVANIDDRASREELNTRVEKELNSDEGKSLIFNEVDGGGIKFEHKDGTNSYIGVNSGGKDEIAAQIYAVEKDNPTKGTKLNIKKDRISYIKDKASSAEVPEDEIATKGDVNTKQDKLPEVVNDRYLHTNVETGELEWVVGSGTGGVSDVKVDGESVVSSGIANINLTGKQDKLPDYTKKDTYLHVDQNDDGELFLNWSEVQGGGEPADYLKTITKDETKKEITITSNKEVTTTFTYGGGGSEPEEYLKKAEVDGNTLKITPKIGEDIVYNPDISTKVDDVQVDGVSVVTDKVANIDLSNKQNKLGVNPETTTATLTGLTIDDVSYKIEGGAGGDVKDVQINGESILIDGVANIKVANNLTTEELNTALSANQGKIIDTRLKALEDKGQFLSNWDVQTGEPVAPLEAGYKFKKGDYFTLTNVDKTATCYKPKGIEVSEAGVVEKEEITGDEKSKIKNGDNYKFDGEQWDYDESFFEVSFSSISGDAKSNGSLKGYLDALDSGKQDKLPTLEENRYLHVKKEGEDLKLEWATISSDGVQDVQVDGTSVVTKGIANISLTSKQDKLTVNPETTTATLTGLTIDGTAYKIEGDKGPDTFVKSSKAELLPDNTGIKLTLTNKDDTTEIFELDALTNTEIDELFND